MKPLLKYCLFACVLAIGDNATVVPVFSQSEPFYTNEVAFTTSGATRTVTSNRWPKQWLGVPRTLTDPATNLHRSPDDYLPTYTGFPNDTFCPNRPSDHPNSKFYMPLNPVANDHNTDVPRNWYFGVALDGVPIEAATAEYYHEILNGLPSGPEHRSWTYEALTSKGKYLGTDGSNGHVQPDGTYHYHGIPYELLARQPGVTFDMETGKVLGMGRDMILLGYAADGFPIYFPWAKKKIGPVYKTIEYLSSYVKRHGPRPNFKDSNGNPTIPIYSLDKTTSYDGTFTQDWQYAAHPVSKFYLDECNGTTGPTPEYPQGTYFYVATRDFPFFPRKFHGSAPDKSFCHAEICP